MKVTASLLITLLLSSCASSPREIDPDEFSRFFESQRACANFVSSIFNAGDGGDLSTSSLEEVRLRLYTDSPPLAAVLGRARLESEDREYDFLDERDQGELGGKLYDAMEELHGFGASSCDVNVKEHFMVYLYERVGADESIASKQLAAYGLQDATAKEKALMSYVLAGRLRMSR